MKAQLLGHLAGSLNLPWLLSFLSHTSLFFPRQANDDWFDEELGELVEDADADVDHADILEDLEDVVEVVEDVDVHASGFLHNIGISAVEFANRLVDDGDDDSVGALVDVVDEAQRRTADETGGFYMVNKDGGTVAGQAQPAGAEHGGIGQGPGAASGQTAPPTGTGSAPAQAPPQNAR